MADNTETDPWDVAFVEPTKASVAELEHWRSIRLRLVETARRYGWTKSEVAKRSGVPASTLWQWFDGSYGGVIGNVTDRIEKWLAAVEEMTVAAARVPTAPGYVPTPTSQKLVDALLYAQMMPHMIVANLGAGLGKTTTADYYVAQRPHAYKVTMRPHVRTVHGMLLELAIALDVGERNPARLDRAIGAKLKRNGRNTLLIVDEAQNLADQAVNELRYFLDEYGCGIALLGNQELYGRFGGHEPKPAYAQLHRRIGMRLQQLQPVAGDIGALLDAWAIEDPEIRRLATAIGRKPGALGQINETLRLAGIYAAGDQRPVTAEDVLRAVANRGLEG